MKLSYRAFDGNGRAVSGTIEVSRIEEAAELLRRDDLYLAEANQVSATTTAGAAGKPARPRQRLKNLAALARQLHVLISSGTPLAQALAAAERQTESDGWRQVIADLRERVESGVALSDAMSNWPECFDSICRSLVAAGESSGNLGEMLNRLSLLMRKQLQMRNSIVGVMIYPCLLTVVGIVVVALMLLFVLPRFTGLFKTLDVALPPTTQMLIGVSDLLRGYWWAVGMGLVGLAVAARAWLGREEGRRSVHALVLRLPKIGNVAKSLILARLTRLLGVLLEGQVPLLDALRLVKPAMGNAQYADLITKAEDAVSGGEAISTAFADTCLVSPSVYETIKSGEQSGRLGQLLLQISDYMDEDNDVIVRALTSIVEPLILIGLGGLVAFIAISMFLPLFDLAAAAQGGGH